MFATDVNDFRAIAGKFVNSHRNCLVEMTFSGLACSYAEDGGALRRIRVRMQPGGRADLYIVLQNRDGSCTVKPVRSISSLYETDRGLRITSDTGIQLYLECVGLHDTTGREKLLAIRHLAEIAQA